uniref:F5/8 type C domain-containing protein n=1 Tax=Myripristis murdjan TaxID=586833 RepID=A0A667WKR1_9TELE
KKDTSVLRSNLLSTGKPLSRAVPEKAIDGNRASKWRQGSCACTRKDLKPWWRVDLLKTHKVNYVTITNRKDCCPQRINGAEIHIGDSLSDNGNKNPRYLCAVVSTISAGGTQTFKCNGMRGRYVNIVIPGKRQYLTLCEVEVYGEPARDIVPTGELCINIARGGKVAQSSTSKNGVPEKAIDGNRANKWKQGSCTHTKEDFKPWWRLDLLKTYKVSYVTVTNRADCRRKNINGAEIHIGNSLDDNGNSNPRCALISSIPAGASKTFSCNGMKGRYVNIVIPGKKEQLSLCEVEVFGTESVDSTDFNCD